MRVVGPRTLVAPKSSPLSQRLRVIGFAALALFLSTSARPAAAQTAGSGWTFEDDAFADLWFHGLAVVGFHGFGPMPLYDPAYAVEHRAEREVTGRSPTDLERRRIEFLGAFQSDPAFEVLHFMPLYFLGVGREDALASLRSVSRGSYDPASVAADTRLGASLAAAVFTRVDQREVLGNFLESLEEEWIASVRPRRARNQGSRQDRMRTLQSTWTREYATALRGFLTSEGFASGVVLSSPGLGIEGRYLGGDPTVGRPTIVALGAPSGDGAAHATLGSLVRELCYPAVRRAFGPFEGRVSDRVDATRVSDLAATRCGELLLEAQVPDRVAAYRVRFGLPSGGADQGFLTASGQVPGAAAFEAQLDAALRRELNLHTGDVGRKGSSVGRE